MLLETFSPSESVAHRDGQEYEIWDRVITLPTFFKMARGREMLSQKWRSEYRLENFPSFVLNELQRFLFEVTID